MNPIPSLEASMSLFGTVYYVAKAGLSQSGDTVNLFMFAEQEPGAPASNVAFATCLPATDGDTDVAKEFRAGTRLIAPVFVPWKDVEGNDMPAEYTVPKEDGQTPILVHRVDIVSVEKVVRPASRAAGNLAALRAAMA